MGKSNTKSKVSVKKDFEKMRKDMRKQLANEAAKISFSASRSRKQSVKLKKSSGSTLKEDFAKIKKNIQKTEKKLEKGAIKKPLKTEMKSKKRTEGLMKIKKLPVKRKNTARGAGKRRIKKEWKPVEKTNSRNKAVKLKVNIRDARAGVSNVKRMYTISKKEIRHANRKLCDIRKELSKVIIGQNDIIDDLLITMLCNGHVLVEGVPGIAKTLIIRALAVATGCKSQRIQFTADLLPTDIIGVSTYDKSNGFHVVKGPIFSNFVLADEINRASPKVQAAMLEAMQERRVTIFKDVYELPNPFFVMATQNPLESLGVYPLPQAQIDRFLFKILMEYPSSSEEQDILVNNITIRDFESYKLNAAVSPEEMVRLQELIKKVYLNERMERYIVNIVDRTRNPGDEGLGRFVQWGASPRASIGLYIASKAAAVLDNSDYVKPHHVKRVLHQVLRHRIILTYEGQAEEISTDDIIDQLVSKVSVP